MWMPLAVLALLSLAGGWLFPIPEFLEPMFPAVEEADESHADVHLGGRGPRRDRSRVPHVHGQAGHGGFAGAAFKAPYTLVYNKYFVDEIYDAAVVQPLVGGSRVVLWKGVDAGLIDGIVNGVGARARDVGGVLRLLQSGNIRSYATWVLFGSVVLIVAHGHRGRSRDEPADRSSLPPAGRLPDRAGDSARVIAAEQPHVGAARFRWSRSSFRSACWPGSTAVRPASSSRSTCRGSPRPTSTSPFRSNGISLWLILLSTFLTPLCVLISWHSIQRPRQGILRLPAAAGIRPGRRLPGAGPLPVLRVLGNLAWCPCTS